MSSESMMQLIEVILQFVSWSVFKSQITRKKLPTIIDSIYAVHRQDTVQAIEQKSIGFSCSIRCHQYAQLYPCNHELACVLLGMFRLHAQLLHQSTETRHWQENYLNRQPGVPFIAENMTVNHATLKISPSQESPTTFGLIMQQWLDICLCHNRRWGSISLPCIVIV